MRKFIVAFILLIGFSGFLAADFDFSKIKSKVSEFTLENGLKFILLEDHSVPIATFMTYANVGGSDERIGIWGVSHVLEHMAFKGTSEIGTTDYEAEKALFNQLDELFNKIIAERDSLNPDQEKLKTLEEEFSALKEKAGKFVIPNDFDNILKKHGAVGLNAGTSKDYTMYLFSLPSNKLELWAYMESSRFTAPVFREFYKEMDVIMEERRVRTENSPVGKLIEDLQAIAFKDHPYHVNGIGPMSNLNHLSRPEVMKYFKTNYTAKNMAIGVAGDVYPDQLKELAKKYFTQIPAGQKNPGVFTNEPKQLGEKTITIFEDSQPWILMAYHSVAATHPDFLKFSILDLVLTSGRSSRLNKKMTIDDKSAMMVFSFNGYPGNKYPGLYLMLALPNSGHKTKELIDVMDKEIESIKKEGITEEELQSAKTRLKISLIQQMGSNAGLMMGMLNSEFVEGSWEKAFDSINQIDTITVKDIQELVKTYLTRSNRSIGIIEKKEEPEEAKQDAKQEEVKK